MQLAWCAVLSCRWYGVTITTCNTYRGCLAVTTILSYLKALHADAMTLSHCFHLILKDSCLLSTLQKSAPFIESGED